MEPTHVTTSEADRRLRSMARLLAAVQEISLARSLEGVISIVRTVARELTGADGATFILRDRNQCHYVDEDAIAPLWKGQRFPLEACVSGWSMLHRRPAIIPDIFDDPRVPVDAYRPTFVRSLVMVPIRTVDPIGAIGTYWATNYHASSSEVDLLQTLANLTSVALENVRVYEELDHRVRERTSELQAANEALEAFAYSVSHDLRNPLTTIQGFASLALHDFDSPERPDFREYFQAIDREARRMTRLIDDLLRMAAINRATLKSALVDLAELARDAVTRQHLKQPDRMVDVHIESALLVRGDAGLLAAAMDNLVSNAWKYTSRRMHARIEIGRSASGETMDTFFIRDNGAGFDMAAAGELFTPFKRLHTAEEFSGTGVGLATVRRIIERHGGTISATAAPDAGARFEFALPRPPAEGLDAHRL